MFGQLEHIFVVHLPHSEDLNLVKDTTVLLVAIRNCEIECRNALGMPYYKNPQRLDVVGIECMQCLVGQVKDVNGKRWAILD